MNVKYSAMIFNRKLLLLLFAAILLVTMLVGLIVSRWSGEVTETFTFPTGYDQEVIIVSCSTGKDSPLLGEVAVQAFEDFESGTESIAKTSAQKMQEAMQLANANNRLPDFREIEAEGFEMRRNLVDEIKERYECEISRRAK